MAVLEKASSNLPEIKTSSTNVSFAEWALLRGATFAPSQQYRTFRMAFSLCTIVFNFCLFSVRC
jgi:hypothetical protein